jgi:hypothetical protein
VGQSRHAAHRGADDGMEMLDAQLFNNFLTGEGYVFQA